MYDVVAEIINHSWVSGSSDQQYIYYTCCALVLLLTIGFVDLIRSLFRQFMPKH